MNSVFVEFFDPLHKRSYPKDSLITKDMGYFIWKSIPVLYYETGEYFNNYHQYKINRLRFISTFYLSRLDFPAFCFSPFSTISMNLLIEEFNPNTISKRINSIFNKKVQVKSSKNIIRHSLMTHKEYQIYCSENEFVDYHIHKRRNFQKIIEKLMDKYEFSEFTINKIGFRKIYDLLSQPSRLLGISLHYYINASRLIHNNFVEDAGINLNLVLEALIKDFMDIKNIKNKRLGIEQFNSTLRLSSPFVEWLEELYSARNEFLAHIDGNMFTFHERINDPDSYCYEHYGSISWLLLKYFSYRKNKLRI